jgi:hypothetical protein
VSGEHVKLEKWALLAEIVGAVAIVISLVYVGYEVSRNTAEIRASNRQSTAARVQDFALMAANNPDLALAADGRTDPDTLTPIQLMQANWYNIAFFRNSEEAYLQYLDGLLSEEYWNTRAVVTISRARRGVGGAYWQSDKRNFSPRFREWLDAELSRE